MCLGGWVGWGVQVEQIQGTGPGPCTGIQVLAHGDQGLGPVQGSLYGEIQFIMDIGHMGSRLWTE